MTRGEHWYATSGNPKIVQGLIVPSSKLLRTQAPPRMSYREAQEYYSKKCRNAFKELGFKYKQSDDFELRLHRVLAKVKKDSKSMLRREINKIEKELKCLTN